MKKFQFRRQYLIELTIALTVAIGGFVAVFVWKTPGMKSVSPAINPFFMLQPQSVTEEAIPDYAGVRRVYAFDMAKAPDNKGRGRSLFVYLRHTIAEIEMDGRIYADTGESVNQWHIGRTPGNYWLTLPIYADYGEKVIRVTLTPVYDSVRDEQPLFLLIDREPLIHLMLLPQEGVLLTLSVLAVASGLFLALTALALGLEPRDRKRVFYLGMFSASGGLWKLCELSVVPLLLDYFGQEKAIWFIGVISYLLMMVFSLRLLTLLHDGEGNRIGRVCCCFAAVSAMLLLALQIAGAVELHDVAVWYGIGAASLHMIALLGQKLSRSELFWLLPNFLALGIDLVIFLRRGSIATPPVYLVWIIGNLFVRGFGFLRAAIQRERLLRTRELELREAKVQTMISQIRPHFLYNTLVTIYDLCKDEPQQAMSAILDFTRYLQANFTALATTELISFSEELNHTKAYISTELLLFGDRLSVEYDTAFTSFRLPPLTLQPIVENAIKYGVGKGHSPGHIIVRTRSVDNGAKVIVEDDGAGYNPRSDGEAHIGLLNVRERLEIMCGGTLEIAPRSSGGTVVTVFVPKEKKQ